ncbi:MAG: ABC transporter permease [Myxococcota bacterium]|nr:ABC transporter permease [Myxococcota bacterium]
MAPESQTRLKPAALWLGAILALVGGALLSIAVSRAELWALVASDLVVGAFGWGPLVMVAKGALTGLQALAAQLPGGLPSAHAGWLLAGVAVWLLGWAVVASGLRSVPAHDGEPSPAAGAPLHPALANYRDFYWRTLLAYGGGMLLAELVLIFVHTLLSSGVPVEGEGAARSGTQLAPTAAFTVALVLACVIAFVAGALGAARSRRISLPEATIGIFYFGLPIPILLTAIGLVPQLQLTLGYRLREVLYLASLLGRPEVGFWVVFGLLVLVMILGITTGFVATGTGRVDLRTGFETYVANRHVTVFRPKLVLGTLAVLMFGIIPPIIIFGIVRAASAAVERTRIRKLGLIDPLRATEALHQARLKEQSPTSMMTALSVGGVGVGVMALIIVLSVMSGFEADLQQKILGTNAHAVVMKYADSMPEYALIMEKVSKVQGVIGQTPFIMNEVMISSEGNISGTIIKGIEPSSVGTVTDLPKNILPPGDITFLDHPERITAREPSDSSLLDEEEDPLIQLPKGQAGAQVLPGLIIGRELAQSLRVSVGDRVNIVSPVGGELGPQGPLPKARPFRVAGIFYSGMFEYDSKFVYIQLDEAKRFFGLEGATGIELKFKDVDDARRLAKTVLAKLGGYPYRARDWGEMNKNLFSALRLEKLVMGIILSIIVIVAAGLIVATVIMLVLEKRKEIAVLKALGVPDGGIVKIFLIEGLQIGIAGGGLGLIAGLSWCYFIERVGIKLDPEVYYIPALPVKIEPVQTAIAVLIAILVTYLGSIYPALNASRVEPVEGLKAE